MTDLGSVVSVNIGLPRHAWQRGRNVDTGIFKAPATGPVVVGDAGCVGDGQADRRHHGGLDKAVYVYSCEYYEYWKQQLGRSYLPWGQFGENLSLSGVTDELVSIGDVLRVGSVVVQVTQPRVPCFKLGLRLGPAIVQQFHQSQRNGFYVRVLERGEVAAGDTVAIMQRDPGGISIAQLYRARFFQPDPMLLRRAAEHPATSTEWRGELLEGLD